MRFKKTNKKRSIQRYIRGWLPKTPNITYAHKPAKPRWKRPVWIAFTLITVVTLAFFAYRGVETLNYYTNPKADITVAYFEKNTNCSTPKIGDVIEVQVNVCWHGHVFPEFMRQVKIVDTYPENNFELIGGNNTIQYNGYGGNKQFEYLLKTVNNNTESIELTKPILYLDDTEISLYNQSRNFETSIEDFT